MLPLDLDFEVFPELIVQGGQRILVLLLQSVPVVPFCGYVLEEGIVEAVEASLDFLGCHQFSIDQSQCCKAFLEFVSVRSHAPRDADDVLTRVDIGGVALQLLIP